MAQQNQNTTKADHKFAIPRGMTVLEYTQSSEYLLERIGPELQLRFCKVSLQLTSNAFRGSPFTSSEAEVREHSVSCPEWIRAAFQGPV